MLPRQFYLITRRCTQRQFLLRPDPETNKAFTYALIEAEQRSQIDVLYTATNPVKDGLVDKEPFASAVSDCDPPHRFAIVVGGGTTMIHLDRDVTGL